jgi:hypothetical protein
MGRGGVASVGVVVALVGSCGLHSWSKGREGGGEVFECRCKRRAGVSNWEGDELHLSLLFLEGRDEGGVYFLGFGCKFIFTT